MADSNHSSSDGLSVDSRDTSQDSKLEFSEDEETLVIRMYNLVGERWTLIAGRIPGRTAEEIEKYWTSRYSTRTAIWGFSPDQNICTMVFQSDGKRIAKKSSTDGPAARKISENGHGNSYKQAAYYIFFMGSPDCLSVHDLPVLPTGYVRTIYCRKTVRFSFYCVALPAADLVFDVQLSKYGAFYSYKNILLFVF
uniref:Uncharacterized protein n=1 Tax=Salix viminalis TaxID=40686 RepID=A0A6N2MP19_SALVM